MRIVFMGTPEFAVPSLKMLYETHEVLCVITQPDRKVGRNKALKKSPVKIYAEYVGLPVYQPEKLRDIEEDIIRLNPDFLITAAYGQMLSSHLLNHLKAINVHGSLLPFYRGGAPIQYALFDGRKETGITVMYMALKMDSGDIIKQKKVAIHDTDDYRTLMLRMSFEGSNLLKEVLSDIDQGIIERYPQNHEDATFAYTIKRADEFLDFNQTPQAIVNRIRGLSPEPGASVFFENQVVKFYRAKTNDIMDSKEKPGTILSVEKKLIVQAKGGTVEILELQVPGKKRMDAHAFLNGQNHFKRYDHFHKGE